MPDPDSARNSRAVVITAVLCAGVVIVAAVFLLTGNGTEPDLADPSPGTTETTPRADDHGHPEPGSATPEECEAVHGAHNVVLWNAVMADEMVLTGCEWPYAPFDVPLDGGEVDPSIDAEFEPRLYAEIWDMLGEADVGVCQITNITEEGGGGFTFGFTYSIATVGCPGAAGILDISVREYATRAFRDQQATSASSARHTFVLGRWVIAIDDAADPDADQPDTDDYDTGDRVAQGLQRLGAVEVD